MWRIVGVSFFCYLHGRGIKSQLASGAGLAVRFLVVSDSWKSNSSEVFPEIGSWQGPHVSTDREDSGIITVVLPVVGWRRRFVRGPLKIVNSRPTHSQPEKLKTMSKDIVNVKISAPRFATFRQNDTEKTTKNINPFYIQKAQDGIAGKAKNASHFKNGIFLVEMINKKKCGLS
jgi:hypothetical protein